MAVEIYTFDGVRRGGRVLLWVFCQIWAKIYFLCSKSGKDPQCRIHLPRQKLTIFYDSGREFFLYKLRRISVSRPPNT